jgi:hypothetical protein
VRGGSALKRSGCPGEARSPGLPLPRTNTLYNNFRDYPKSST